MREGEGGSDSNDVGFPEATERRRIPSGGRSGEGGAADNVAIALEMVRDEEREKDLENF